jgi:hypothetical protein
MNTLNPHAVGQHEKVSLLLPWYLNKSLQGDELQQVEQHLRSCLICRREMQALDKLSKAVRQPSDLEMAAKLSFAGLKNKLPMPPAGVSASESFSNPVASQSYGLLRPLKTRNLLKAMPRFAYPYLAIAATVLMAVIPLLLYFPNAKLTANYYTLAAAKPEAVAGPQLRVVFSPALPKSQIDAVLQQIQGQVVDEPNSVGAYTVKLTHADSPNSSIEAALVFLRRQPVVVLAEPVLQP